MTFDELIKQRENIKYQIRVNELKIAELKRTYFKQGGESVGGGTKNNTSPQEIIIVRIDELERAIFDLENDLHKIDEQIENKLLLIDNPEYRMIVFQKIQGQSWKQINSCFSPGYTKKIYADSLKYIKEVER